MNSFLNLKIGTRLGAGFAAVLLLLAGIAVLGLNAMTDIQTRLNGIVTGNNVKVASVNKMVRFCPTSPAAPVITILSLDCIKRRTFWSALPL